MQTTNISWADYSWNPVTGCSHAGPECWNCYAEAMTLQQAQRADPPPGISEKPWTVENASDVVTTHPSRLREPDAFSFPEGPGRVFVGSMTDMFHSEVEPLFVQRVLDRCGEFPEHEWIFLTKRPQNAARWQLTWPANTWLGTSVGSGPGGEYPSTTHRIEQLRDVRRRRAFGADSPRLWVSFEPLIEPIGEVALDHIEWAVVGGENASDADRREMDHAWAREVFRQCRAADVPFFFKQSSAATNESGTRLTVEREGGVLVQQEIREFAPPAPVVTEAREAIEG